MPSEELLPIALRVMGRHLDHREPAMPDVERLRQALPGNSGLSIEEMASRIIDRELRKGVAPRDTIVAVESDHSS